MPMSSTTMRSARQIRVTVRATDPSAFALVIAAVRVSRVNQATLRSFSIAAWARASARWLLRVPDGPATTRFSARLIHSRVASAFWVASGTDDSSGRQEENVLPAGKAAVLRRIRRVAASRPVTSSASRTRSTSAGSHRWAPAVGRQTGAALSREGGPTRRTSASRPAGFGGAARAGPRGPAAAGGRRGGGRGGGAEVVDGQGSLAARAGGAAAGPGGLGGRGDRVRERRAAVGLAPLQQHEAGRQAAADVGDLVGGQDHVLAGPGQRHRP